MTEVIALTARLTIPRFFGAAVFLAVFLAFGRLIGLRAAALRVVFFAAIFRDFLAGVLRAFLAAVLRDFFAAFLPDFLVAFLAIEFLHSFCLVAAGIVVPAATLHRTFTRDSLTRFAFREKAKRRSDGYFRS